MASAEQLAIAAEVMKRLPSLVKAHGVHTAPSGTRPGVWLLGVDGWQISLAENVLLLPNDPSLSTLLDIWPSGGRKVFSASWMPEKPWVPPHITQCKPGAWRALLIDGTARRFDASGE